MTIATTPQTIFSQINRGVLMSLGSSDFGQYDNALVFTARILPMTKTGRGTRARKMFVKIELDPSDTYNVRVTYAKGKFDLVTHFEKTGIYADQLNNLLLALDYDGAQVANPRYWH